MPIPFIIGAVIAAAATGVAVKTIDDVVEGSDLRDEAEAIERRASSKMKDMEERKSRFKDKSEACLKEFGEFRLNIQKETFGRFVKINQKIGKQVSPKEMKDFDFDLEFNKSCVEMHKVASNALDATFLAAGSATPAALCGAVALWGTASTGTALSALSGAAATKATLAALGGGSLAAGGGGVALGTAVLGTAGVGLVAAPIIASSFYKSGGEKKKTAAVEYEAKVDVLVSEFESKLELYSRVFTRIDEIKGLLQSLSQRAHLQMDRLDGYVQGGFNKNSSNHISCYTNVSNCLKALREILELPLLNKNGDDLNNNFNAGKYRNV